MRSLDLTEHTHAPERLACDNFAPQAVIYKLNSYCRAAVVHKKYKSVYKALIFIVICIWRTPSSNPTH